MTPRCKHRLKDKHKLIVRLTGQINMHAHITQTHAVARVQMGDNGSESNSEPSTRIFHYWMLSTTSSSKVESA